MATEAKILPHSPVSLKMLSVLCIRSCHLPFHSWSMRASSCAAFVQTVTVLSCQSLPVSWSLSSNWCRKASVKWPFFHSLHSLLHHSYPVSYMPEHEHHIHLCLLMQKEEIGRYHKMLVVLLNFFPPLYKSVPCEREHFIPIPPCQFWIVNYGAAAICCPALKNSFFSWTSRLIFMFKCLARIQNISLAIKMHPREHIGN